MAEQFKDRGTIAVLTSDKPVNYGNDQLVPISPPDTVFKEVNFIKVDGLLNLDHPSSDKTVTLSAVDLCDAVGIKKSAVARALHEGHGYPITEIKTVQPFKVGDPNLKGVLRTSKEGFVSWEVVEENKSNLLLGQVQTENGLVVLDHSVARAASLPEKVIEITAVFAEKQTSLEAENSRADVLASRLSLLKKAA